MTPTFPRKCTESSHQYSQECWCWAIGVNLTNGRPYAILENRDDARDVIVGVYSRRIGPCDKLLTFLCSFEDPLYPKPIQSVSS